MGVGPQRCGARAHTGGLRGDPQALGCGKDLRLDLPEPKDEPRLRVLGRDDGSVDLCDDDPADAQKARERSYVMASQTPSTACCDDIELGGDGRMRRHTRVPMTGKDRSQSPAGRSIEGAMVPTSLQFAVDTAIAKKYIKDSPEYIPNLFRIHCGLLKCLLAVMGT